MNFHGQQQQQQQPGAYHQQQSAYYSQQPAVQYAMPPQTTQQTAPPVYETQAHYAYHATSHIAPGYEQHQTQQQYYPPGPTVHAVRGGAGRGRGRGGGGGGRGGHYNHGPKPIKATEIKAYIYAWCNQLKKKPEYLYETVGLLPKVTYRCKLDVAGFAPCHAEAKSKKDAQTLAAWEFAEYLVSMGKVARGDLPAKPECVVKTTELLTPNIGVLKTPLTGDGGEGDNVEEYGGWTTENARQRLNRFCMSERISCDFQNHSEGPCHSKVSISTLSFMIDRADTKPLTVSVRASNKKTANSTCALQMVRLLYKEGLIERHGERAGTAPKAWCNLTQHQQQQQSTQQHTDETEPTQTIGTKRKADDEVRFDENGNWTLETAKNRLSKLYQAKGLDFNAPLQCSEVGFPPNKQYQCQFSIEHEGATFSTCVLAENKKTAQRRACLDVVIQLYQAGHIPGNKGDRYGHTTPLLGNKRGRGNYHRLGTRVPMGDSSDGSQRSTSTATPWDGGKPGLIV